MSLGSLGQNHFWRHLLTIVATFVATQLGSLPFVFYALSLVEEEKALTQTDSGDFWLSLFATANQTNPILAYFLLNLTFAFSLAIFYFCLKFVHRRPFLSLITPESRFNWSRFTQGALVHLLIMLGFYAYAEVTQGATFSLNPQFKWETWLPFVPLALVMTGIQILAEEVFFRGYLLQLFTLKLKNPILPILFSTLLFGAGHLSNPENSLGLLITLDYFLIGLTWTLATVLDDGLELAIGAHLVQNLFAVLFVSYVGGVLPVTGIFLVENLRWGLPETLVSVLMYVSFLLIFFSPFGQKILPRNSQPTSFLSPKL